MDVENLFPEQGQVQLIDSSGEGLFDRDGDDLIGVGDTLFGMFNISAVRTAAGDTGVGGGTGMNELSGVFAIQVQSLSIIADPNGNCVDLACSNGLDGDEVANYVFQADAGMAALFGLPAGTFSAGTTLAFFEDETPDFVLGIPTLSTATDGELVLEAGLPGTDADERWTGVGISDLSLGDLGVPGTPQTTISADLSIISESFDVMFLQTAATGGPGGPLDDGLIDLALTADLLSAGGTGNGFPFLNQATFTVNVIPEPGSLGLFGFGLAALVAFGYRRRRAA